MEKKVSFVEEIERINKLRLQDEREQAQKKLAQTKRMKAGHFVQRKVRIEITRKVQAGFILKHSTEYVIGQLVWITDNFCRLDNPQPSNLRQIETVRIM